MSGRYVSVMCALGSVIGSAVAASPALAQSADGSLRSAQDANVDLFARDRSVAVRARPRPEYEALGLTLGAFSAFPKVELGLEHNDNIYATSTGEVSDQIWRVRPEVNVVSNWPRHSVSTYARASLNRYADRETENSNDWGVGGAGRLDFARKTTVAFGADYQRAVEPRSSSSTPTAAAEPIGYDVASAYVGGASTGGRLRLSGRADWRSYNYDDGVDVLGGVIDQDERDRDVVSGLGRADWAVSPATAVFVQASVNDRSYSEPSTATYAARDSSGYELLTGVNFELGAVARGEIAAGYISQSFDQAAYGDVDGYGARASLEWFPTQLTTVTLSGSRTVEDSAIAGSGGYLSTGGSIQIDHELLRNLIVSANLNLATDDYEGIDRSDDRFTASIGASYFMNRRLGVSVTASRYDQSSSGAAAGTEFGQNRLMVSLVTQF
jgi:hypothetical protein